MIGLYLRQTPPLALRPHFARAELPGPITRPKLRDRSESSQWILSCCSREHAQVKANFDACRSAATVCYLIRGLDELAAAGATIDRIRRTVPGRLRRSSVATEWKKCCCPGVNIESAIK